MNFADYLKNRSNALENITASLEKEVNREQSGGDDRIWKPKMGSDNTGYAVVRFLPGKDLNKTPWVKMYDHGFQGPTGKWYIENSLTTLSQKDPVSEYNSKLWNNGTEEGKETARKQKRRTSYYANVLVIKDPNDPSNEGKVKIYKFGQKIFDKIMTAMKPEFADEDPVNPFDLFEGANFRIKIKMVAGYWNYDSSDFEKPSPLSEDESKLEKIFEAQYDVHEFHDPSNFKTYEELSTRLNEVLELTSTASAPQRAADPVEEKSEFDDYFKADDETASTAVSSTDDDDDLESYFKNLSAD
jgi:hypothetical protein